MPDQDPVRVNRHPPKRRHFRRVEQARELLEKNSSAIMRATITRALMGNTKAQCWLLEHTAATDDQGREIRPIAPAVDRQGLERNDNASNHPRIVIGVQLGADFARLVDPAAAAVAALPPAILDIASPSVSEDAPACENPKESAPVHVLPKHADSAE